MTAVETKRISGLLLPKMEDVVSSKLLMHAASTLDGIIDSGIGRLEVKVFQKQYRMEFEVENEVDEG
jgi:hypothetical protein